MKTPTKSISIYMSYDDISSWEYMKEILGMTTNNTLEVLLDNLVLLEDGYEYNKRRGGDLLSVKVSAVSVIFKAKQFLAEPPALKARVPV